MERTTSQTNISLAEAQGAFYILGIGLTVATLILAAEKIWTKSKNRKFSRKGAVKRNDDFQNGGVFHIGSLPPIVVTSGRPKSYTKGDSNLRIRELQSNFAAPTFSPYATDFRLRKVRKSKSFPIIFSMCCRQKPKTDDDVVHWEIPEINGKYDRQKTNTSQVKTSTFSDDTLVPGYSRTEHTTRDGKGIRLGSSLRRWHSDNGTVDFRYYKDAETGEFSNVRHRKKGHAK